MPAHAVVIVALIVATLGAANGIQAPSQAYDDILQKGETALRRAEYREALDTFKRAIIVKPTAEGLFGIARAYVGLDSYELAIDFCRQALAVGGGQDPGLEGEIKNLRATSLMALARGPDDPKLDEAEADLRAVADKIPEARFNLGVALLKQNKDAEGIRELRTYIDESGDTLDGDVEKMIANPRRAREPYAREFILKDLDGKRRTLSEFIGTVVVLDFWGSWCPPCVKATPGLMKVAKKFEGRVVLIGINEGDSDSAWHRFLANHQMTWPQCRDNGRYAQAYNVRAYPTYVIVDGDGMVRARRSGYESRQTDTWLENELEKVLNSPPSSIEPHQ
jgi:thiol-disulfide isomerase/thioredoxin